MAGKKEGMLNFNIFVSLIVLIPSAMLLVQYLGDLQRVCSAAENTMIFAVVAGCMMLLSLMTLIKELLVGQ